MGFRGLFTFRAATFGMIVGGVVEIEVSISLFPSVLCCVHCKVFPVVFETWAQSCRGRLLAWRNLAEKVLSQVICDRVACLVGFQT